MAERFQKLTDALREQATPRSLIGLGLLAVMLAAVGLSSLVERVEDQRTRTQELERSVAIQRSLADGEQWLETVSVLREQREAVEGRFWRGTTTGIVAAQLQSQIEDAAERAGLDRIRLEVQPLPESLSSDGRVQFEVMLTARDRDGQFLSLFQQLQDLHGTIVPSDFEWRRPNGSVRATLLAPAIIESPANAGGRGA